MVVDEHPVEAAPPGVPTTLGPTTLGPGTASPDTVIPHTVIPGTASPATERAYQHIKQQVLSGRLDGELLSEASFATPLQMSRTPVREAFLRLQAEGLMRLYPKRGALVLPVAPHEAREVLEARLLLECHGICSLTDPRTRAAVVAVLDPLVAEQELEPDASTFAALDDAFHTQLARAAGNHLLDGFHDSLRDRQQRMIARVVGRHRDTAALARQHREIVAALAAGDLQAARDLLTSHLHTSYEGIL